MPPYPLARCCCRVSGRGEPYSTRKPEPFVNSGLDDRRSVVLISALDAVALLAHGFGLEGRLPRSTVPPFAHPDCARRR